jgi:hypothetical protein
MSSKEEKDAIISKVYYDPSGYGSLQATYNESRLKDITISKQFVQGWFSENINKTKQPGGKNSFVAPGPGYEYQIDLFYLSDLKNQKMKYGCVCIDIFTKYAWVVAIPTRKGGSVAFGIIECLNNMKNHNFDGNPSIIYTDAEQAMDLKEFYTERKIKHYITRNHAAFAERFIRTYKAMLYKRIDSVKENNIGDPQWTDYNYQVLLTYNNKLVHSSTKMTPQDAAKQTNEVDVKTNLELRAKKNRNYPPLNVGDNVKILRKKKVNEKERTSHWSVDSYPVTSISEELGQKYYTVEARQYIRGEVLKV